MSAVAKAEVSSAAEEVNPRPAEKLSDKGRLERALKVLRRIVEEGQSGIEAREISETMSARSR